MSTTISGGNDTATEPGTTVNPRAAWRAADTAEGNGVLTGVRVLDLSRVLAGPYCAQTLADHGAEVIKVEAPSGDETRGWGPPFVDDDTSSAYYNSLNHSKENICLDLRTDEGRAVLADLLAGADVVIENFKAAPCLAGASTSRRSSPYGIPVWCIAASPASGWTDRWAAYPATMRYSSRSAV